MVLLNSKASYRSMDLNFIDVYLLPPPPFPSQPIFSIQIITKACLENAGCAFNYLAFSVNLCLLKFIAYFFLQILILFYLQPFNIFKACFNKIGSSPGFFCVLKSTNIFNFITVDLFWIFLRLLLKIEDFLSYCL